MSQGSLVFPTSGTLSGLSLVDQLDAALDALATMNSGAVAPTNAAESMPPGQYWLNTTSNPWQVCVSDGTSWVVVGYLNSTTHIYTAKGVTGTGSDWWGPASSIPPGSLLAYGQVLTIAAYPALGALFGSIYGGDGVTTFGMPDKRGRASAGVDNMGGAAANRLTSGGSGILGTVLGATGGAETVTLTSSTMPAHSHTDGGHAHTASSTPHSHGTGTTGGGNFMIGNNTSGPGIGLGTGSSFTLAEDPSPNTGTTTVGVTVNTGYASISSTGGGGAHENAQPTIVCNYIIWI